MYVDNPIYDKTNNIYLLSLAKQQLIENNTIQIKSDLNFEYSLFDKILKCNHKNVVLVDKYESWMDGTIARLDDNHNIVNFIPKKCVLDLAQWCAKRVILLVDFAEGYPAIHCYAMMPGRIPIGYA
mgnify:CR=1 FL=1